MLRNTLSTPTFQIFILTIFNTNICNNVCSIEMICVSLHQQRNKLKQHNIMTTILGHYEGYEISSRYGKFYARRNEVVYVSETLEPLKGMINRGGSRLDYLAS